MKHYNFPADAFIGWIRIARPGSVLGPQQQFLNDIQDEMFKRGIEHRKKFNLSDDLILKLENLKLGSNKEKTKMTEDDKKKAKFGEEGQGNYLTQNKKQHGGNK
jgi:cell division cycle 14